MSTTAFWAGAALVIVTIAAVIVRRLARLRAATPKDVGRRSIAHLSHERDHRALWAAGSLGVMAIESGSIPGSGGCEAGCGGGCGAGCGAGCGGGCGGCGG